MGIREGPGANGYQEGAYNQLLRTFHLIVLQPQQEGGRGHGEVGVFSGSADEGTAAAQRNRRGGRRGR